MSALLTTSIGRGKTALVTGASGFIGRALVQRLLDRQCIVHVLSRRPFAEGPDASDCRQFIGDIRDVEILQQACAGVDVVFHLAAYAHVSQHDNAQLHAINVDGTRAVLAAAKAGGVRRIVFFSSSLAAENNTTLTSYGRVKRDAELLLLAAASTGEIEVCCLRPVNVYGPGMKGNLLTLIRLIRKGVFPPLPVPSATLSLVGHRDLCEAALLAAASPRANGQIYTVTDGRTYTMKGIELTVRKALGKAPMNWQT
ncbi:MAG: NAD-dependent epimerase/dehydratase family protein, partial [Pseudohongiellaceae bacterium]